MGLFQKLFGLTGKNAFTTDKQEEESIDLPFEIKITTSYGSSGNVDRQEKFGPIKGNSKDGWIINPGASFPLTILNADTTVAEQLRSILDDDAHYYESDGKLLALFAGYNIRVKEIEEYKNKYKPAYLQTIANLKSSSTEWQQSGDMDKEDMLIEFREKALDKIYEVAHCDLEVLFENEPGDITADDQLIDEYGFENMQVYLRYADRLDKIRIVPNDDRDRQIFEKLVTQGLAIRGIQIPKDEILASATLKELNAIAKNPEKEYKRKNQAVEYILSLPNADALISKHIALRELFKLKALPEKYASIDLQVIAGTWNYNQQEVRLLRETFRKSWYAWRDMKDTEYVDKFTVTPANEDDPCPCGLEMSRKTYKKNNPPTFPCHIGCNCYLNKEMKYD